MEVYDYPHFCLQAAVCLLTDVKNGPEIRKKIVQAATCQGEEGNALRDAVNFAFIDARLVSGSQRYPTLFPFRLMGPSVKITSILHLQTAIYYALLAQSQECLRTKTVHSEILWALNPSNNVRVSIPTSDLTH
jgi:EKC/KEOPS complex subunit CGI121/TPRKB